MTLFVHREGDLTFTFSADCYVKWDDHPRFSRGLARLPPTKAVDYVVRTGDGRTTLVEAKDFRSYRIENKPRLHHGGEALATEVARKVLDTVAALVWASKREKDDEVERVTSTLLLADKLHVVLWLEQERMDPAVAQGLADEIRGKLRPISSKVTVTSIGLEKQRSAPLSWVKVASHPRRKR